MKDLEPRGIVFERRSLLSSPNLPLEGNSENETQGSCGNIQGGISYSSVPAASYNQENSARRPWNE